MNRRNRKERGQALILIVFAIVGLIGLTGLAIDGGNAYSERRHAQNAADTAAIAAALNKTRLRANWADMGAAIAAENGYVNSGTTTVIVRSCQGATDPACVLGTSAIPANYVQVVITSTIRTFFAPVVGIRTITNTVQAIAQAIPGTPTPWYNGNVLVALMPGCKDSSWNHDPFDFAGSEVSIINGTGIFVNSNCNPAFIDNGSGNQMTVNGPSGVCVVGGVDPGLTGVSPVPQANCGSQLNTEQYASPPLNSDSCQHEGKLVGGAWDGIGYIDNLGGGVARVHPGKFTAQFPPGSYTRWNLMQGIYCLEGGIKLTGGILTSDWNGNGIYDVSSEGVILYVESGGVDMSGGASVNLHAITSTINPLGPDLVGYLMYVPATNGSSITLTGGSASQYVGTILAPRSFVTLNGGNTGDSLNLDAQIIAYSLRLTGSGNLNITYNQSSNATTWTNPSISQYK